MWSRSSDNCPRGILVKKTKKRQTSKALRRQPWCYVVFCFTNTIDKVTYIPRHSHPNAYLYMMHTDCNVICHRKSVHWGKYCWLRWLTYTPTNSPHGNWVHLFYTEGLYCLSDSVLCRNVIIFIHDTMSFWLPQEKFILGFYGVGKKNTIISFLVYSD